MKLALLAPSPVPYTPGGAENLLSGLYDALRQQGQHQIELLKHPTPEHSFADLLHGYRFYSRLDLTHFDAIISCKYPAWMAQHPQHLCWMLHPLRGLYDSYPADWPQALHQAPEALNPLLSLLARQPERACLEDSFALAEAAWSDHPELFDLPSPLVRQIVHFWDRIALHPEALHARFCISRTVQQRPNYFQQAHTVQVLHPPISLKSSPSSPSKTEQAHQAATPFIFTASRLDAPKRIDLILQAYQRLNTSVELHIAGTGPQSAYLQACAAQDPRIRFLGHLTQEQLLCAYQQAEIVLFTPYNEDYGLIAPEALSQGCPVITTSDAGGVTEIVHHQHNGLIVPPSASALALAIASLLDHPQERQRLAQNAQPSVAHLNWPTQLAQLIAPLKEPSIPEHLFSSSHSARPLKIVVAVTFPAWPVQGGGQQRLYQLYRQLARHYQVELVCLGARNASHQLADQLMHHECAYTPEQHRISGGLHQRLDKDLTDVAAYYSSFYNPQWLARLQQATQDADYVITCHPFLHAAIRGVWDGPILYEAQDIEPDVKTGLLAGLDDAGPLLTLIQQIERRCLQDSQLVFTCSQQDQQRLHQLYPYQVPPQRVVPNGVNTQETPYTCYAEREARRTRLGLTGESLLFMGSLHPPNIEAAQHFLQLAQRFPQHEFWLVGSVCQAPELHYSGANLRTFGLVSEAQRQALLASATLALNPMHSGSGTNLKMLDYTAAGLPVLSTPFGLRGLNLPQDAVYQAEQSHFSVTIEAYTQTSAAERDYRASLARQKTEQEYDWSVCAEPLINWLAQSSRATGLY
ncbi:glycosyltransferase [Marinospirillum sp. MEB164]|uniref:Glycosyltransferase n=1 Tax=Marinospirillum alkalitolerans TaxID=3123374 RepID=A0ABW8PVS0_9GAMM